MMQVLGSAARVNGEGTYTDSRDHGKQFSVGRLGNFDKSEETKMTESKILLVLDKKDYEDGMPVFERKCVRAIIEKNGKIAVQRGRAGDCKILGGGMDGEEDFETALSREVLEEGGLIVMGNEGNGIGDEVERLINRKLYIPNYPAERETSESLNVAIATAVVCAEFRRQAAMLQCQN